MMRGTAQAQRPVPPTGRRAELLLLVLAVAIAVYGYVDVGSDMDGEVPSDTLRYGLGLGGLALLAHLAVRRWARYADPLLLPIAVLLNGLGLVVIYRLDRSTPNDSAAPTQLVWSTIGVALFIAVVILLRDHRALQRYAYVLALATLLLMLVPVFLPAVYGAKIWIKVGSLSFQPGEVAKIAFAVFFASYLAQHRDALALTGRRIWRLELPRGRNLGPILLIWLIGGAILFLEQDLGTLLIFFGLFVVMLYVATGRTGWIAVGLILVGVAVVPVALWEPHVHVRFLDWLDPMRTIRLGQGPSQLAQSMFAFAAGGMLGTGLGLGHSYLIGFAMKSDWILATFGEEIGLAGVAALLLLYAIVVGRGYRIGRELRDPFGRLLAIGLASLLALQVFVVAGGVTDLIPLTGMTMPFLARGGSSLVTNWILIALLVKLSDAARRPRPPVTQLLTPLPGAGADGGDSDAADRDAPGSDDVVGGEPDRDDPAPGGPERRDPASREPAPRRPAPGESHGAEPGPGHGRRKGGRCDGGHRRAVAARGAPGAEVLRAGPRV